MIKVKPLVKFEILLQAHGLHSTGQQADHCLDLVHNNLYLVQLVHAKLPEIAKICSVHICVGIIGAKHRACPPCQLSKLVPGKHLKIDMNCLIHNI